jgi:hypothetical protein
MPPSTEKSPEKIARDPDNLLHVLHDQLMESFIRPCRAPEKASVTGDAPPKQPTTKNTTTFALPTTRSRDYAGKTPHRDSHANKGGPPP